MYEKYKKYKYIINFFNEEIHKVLLIKRELYGAVCFVFQDFLFCFSGLF